MRRPDPSARDTGEAVDHVEIDAGDTLWRFERGFLTSNWTCVWGRGCQGILPEPAPHLHHGCCSFGAELDGLDEARTVAAFADTLPPELFQHRAAGVLAAGESPVDWTSSECWQLLVKVD